MEIAPLLLNLDAQLPTSLLVAAQQMAKVVEEVQEEELMSRLHENLSFTSASMECPHGDSPLSFSSIAFRSLHFAPLHLSITLAGASLPPQFNKLPYHLSGLLNTGDSAAPPHLRLHMSRLLNRHCAPNLCCHCLRHMSERDECGAV